MNDLLVRLSDGNFHSGSELGALVGLSRSGVWKRLQHLRQEYGLVVHAVPGKGYRLSAPLSLLTTLAVQDGLRLPWEVEIVNIIDSTNNEVYRRLAAGEPPPFGVAAEQQSAGKGRRGRPWVSPFGQNIYYSVVTELQGLQQLEGLSLTAGVAVIDALKAVGVTTAGLKWPNDVIIDDRKVAGVLVELHGDLSEYCRAVIGIGINVNMRETAAVDQPWTSLRNATGNNFNRSEVLLQLTKSLGACLELHACSGFQALKDRWEDMHVWAGREVILSSGAQITRGIALGVDRRGALRMQTSCGEQIFSGGELSLRLCR